MIHIDADFECGSGGEICKIGESAYAVEPKPELVPDWFLKALDQHFGGAGVPREYAFHVRLRSSASEPLQCSVRCIFTQTSGKGYMTPPAMPMMTGFFTVLSSPSLKIARKRG